MPISVYDGCELLVHAIPVPVEVPRIWCICVSINLEVLCLRMKSSIMHTIWGGGQFVGSRCLYSSMK